MTAPGPLAAGRCTPVSRLAAGVCAGILAAGCGAADPPAGRTAGAPTPGAGGVPAETFATPDEDLRKPSPEPGAEVVREPLPVAVEIPAIGVEADVVPVGLDDGGSMEVPDFGFAGWYTEGPVPGAVGPAVIVAHVDSADGPDVFYGLAELRPGDAVHVHREDGSVASFVVEDLEQQPKDELPGERIWAASTEPRLTLITCGGVFDRSVGHYDDNVIAYAASKPV